MKKKTWRQRLTKNNDNLLREVIRLRDNDTCNWCNKHVEGSNSQPSHIIPKGRCLYLRWDLLNVKLLCNSCHRKWHNNPISAIEWFTEKFPARYKYVKARQYRITHWLKGDYEKIKERLEAKKAELENENTNSV